MRGGVGWVGGEMGTRSCELGILWSSLVRELCNNKQHGRFRSFEHKRSEM